MGWASYIYIKTNDIDLLISKIKNYYVVGQIVVESEPNNWMFLRSDGPRTFIVNCNYSTEWTQLDFPLENRYEFDEMFRRISLELSTVVLLGYYNSIDGSFRFAVIDKGKLVRSICISSLSSGELRLIDNFGSAFPFEKIPLIRTILDEDVPVCFS